MKPEDIDLCADIGLCIIGIPMLVIFDIFFIGLCIWWKITSTRVLRFNPTTKENKFEQCESQPSEYIEAVAKQCLSTTNVQINLETEPISDCLDENHAFLIRNVLTPNECEQVIKAAALTGFKQRQFGGDGDDSATCCFESNLLSNDVIFSRIKDYLPAQSYFDTDSKLTLSRAKYWSSHQTIECYGRLSCLNTSCRVKRCASKQHFKVYRDETVKVPNTTDAFTVYSILIYLNDDYSGGSTQFCLYEDIYAKKDAESRYDYLDVKGNAGDALVFRHELLHKDDYVHERTKYILRLDAAYTPYEPLAE